MPSLELLLPFAAATLVFALLPGPALLYSAAQTLARGRRGGLMAALGIHCGGMVHVLAGAAGLAALFQLVPALFTVMKIAGALYLIWLGIGILRSRMDFDTLPTVTPRRARRAFVESMAVEILNPKAALFFLAFLPQFVDPAAGLPVWSQFLILGWIVNAAFSSADLLVIFTTEAMMAGLKRSQRGQRLIKFAGGSILIGLGIHLAVGRT